jgi:hypothetical protein
LYDGLDPGAPHVQRVDPGSPLRRACAAAWVWLMAIPMAERHGQVVHIGGKPLRARSRSSALATRWRPYEHVFSPAVRNPVGELLHVCRGQPLLPALAMHGDLLGRHRVPLIF